MRRGVSASTALLLAALAGSPAIAQTQAPAWMHQFGTTAPDDAEDMTVDASGNVYVVGQTFGTLPGQTSAGMVDAYVRKYDPAGNEAWTRQFGSYERDFAKGVDVDGTGAVYVAGRTFGTLPDQVSAGGFDAFVRKYDQGGNELWTRQFGSGGGEGAVSIAVDGAGNAFVAGSCRATLPGQVSAGQFDPFLRKYDPAGHEVWTRQFGSLDDDFAVDVAVDPAGSAVVVGQTLGQFPGQAGVGGVDAFIRHFDDGGNHHWTHQFGSSADDRALSVFLDADGASYIAGATNGSFPGYVSAGDTDAFVRKFDRGGNDAWGRQFGTPRYDDAGSVAVDAVGMVYVSGRTAGAWAGQRSAGGYDAYVRKQDPGGTEIWNRQFGTSQGDYSLALALDAAGVTHVAGGTLGVLDGQVNAGGRDAFVGRLHAPAPSRQPAAPLLPSL